MRGRRLRLARGHSERKRPDLVSDTPKAIVGKKHAANLEEAFIAYLEGAIGGPANQPAGPPRADRTDGAHPPAPHRAPSVHRFFDPRRMLSYARRETLELVRDPVRATMALLGSLILLFVVGFGVNMDVKDLTFAVLDRDDSTISRAYVLELAGSRYFIEKLPITDYQDMDRRMRAGEINLALEIPPGFGRDVLRGKNVQIGGWIDGSNPQRAETVSGEVTEFLQRYRAESDLPIDLSVRARFNPEFDAG